MSLNVDIRLKRPSKIYYFRNIVSGVLRLDHSGEFKHEGITLTMYGDVTLECSPKHPIQLVYCPVDICRPGKLPSGVTEIPFEIPLEPCLNRKLYETYHGVYVNIRYKLRCEVRRNFLGKNISKEIEFIVEAPTATPAVPSRFKDRWLKPLDILVTPTMLKNSGVDVSTLPNFKIDLHLDSVVCNLEEPFTGSIMFEKGNIILKSVELQLVRVESCSYNTKGEPDRTEIQNVQIVDGNVPDNLTIPICMPFPKLFTCPSLLTSNFTIEFEANFLITFKNQHLINENVTLTLIRD